MPHLLGFATGKHGDPRSYPPFPTGSKVFKCLTRKGVLASLPSPAHQDTTRRTDTAGGISRVAPARQASTSLPLYSSIPRTLIDLAQCVPVSKAARGPSRVSAAVGGDEWGTNPEQSLPPEGGGPFEKETQAQACAQGQSAEQAAQTPSQDPALDPDLGPSCVVLLLEVEGVMVDIHRAGHLDAFNSAFLASGMGWARWNMTTYSTLHRHTGGDPRAMLQLFFERQQRWPREGMDAAAKASALADLLRHKDKALAEAVEAQRVPLRPGLVGLLEDAVGAGCKVAALAAQPRCGEDTARKLLGRLPPHLKEVVLAVGKAEAEGSLFWQLVQSQRYGPGATPEEGLAAQLSDAVVARKQQVAQHVSQVLKVRAEVDTGSRGSEGALGVAALRAACERLQAPLARALVLAGSQTMVQVAARAGLPSLAVRSSITTQAEFPGALQTYEDFGPGSLTLQRLLRKLDVQ